MRVVLVNVEGDAVVNMRVEDILGAQSEFEVLEGWEIGMRSEEGPSCMKRDVRCCRAVRRW